jgi:sterol desaturase/sphingolipid hydroxylase (fatty acid hydroxylase superfamily)
MTALDRTLLVLLFIIGISMHVLLRAGYAYRSAVNTTPSRRAWVVRNWDTLLIRTGFNSVLFWVWMYYPGTFAKAAIGVGVPAWIGNWLTVPVTLGTAYLFGFFIDVLLDAVQSIAASVPQLAWITKYILHGQVPEYDATLVDVAKLRLIEEAKNAA